MVSNIYSTRNIHKQCHAELYYVTHALEGQEGDTTTFKPLAGLLGPLYYIGKNICIQLS